MTPAFYDRDYIRSTVLQRYPQGLLFSWVDINPTELCNRTCSFCPRGVDYPNTNLHITDDVIEKIGIDLEEVDFQGMINICGNGEPLLSKNLIPLISCLSKFSIELVTNGDELVEGRIVELYDAGIDYINVSLYDGEHQLDEFHNLFERCGIPESNYTLREYWVVPDGFANRAGSLDFGNPRINESCYYLHYSIQIDWNGDVLFCVQSVYNKSITHGNILETSMKDIWYGESMSKYRELLKENRHHSPCNKCDVIGTRFGENFVDEWGV
jgi:radical SAM protein with 4Fe4S-binding SPASM domain